MGPSASPSNLKPLIRGLVDKDGPPQSPYVKVIHAYVILANWSDLQPTQNGPIAADNAIDRAISSVRQLNQANPKLDMKLKLRVLGGVYAPNWVKNLGGPPFTIRGNGTATVGRFWLDGYGSAYQDLQQKLAAKYDVVAELREVVVARCMTFSAEPFVRDATNTENARAYLAAGYTTALDHRCQEQQADESRAWQHTWLDVSFNPAQSIRPDGTTFFDEGWTETVMNYCRYTLGKQCVLENNSLSAPVKSSTYRQMYAKMRSLGPPLVFQTQDNVKVNDMPASLQYAFDLGANSVELHEGFEALVSINQLAPFDNMLSASAY